MSLEKFNLLKSKLKTIHNIDSSAAVLAWDQNVYMPEGGALTRGEQMATLRSLSHELSTTRELGVLLDETQVFSTSQGEKSFEKCLWDRARRDFDRALSVPKDFVERFSKHTSATYNAWHQARRDDDFKRMIPYLEKTVDFSLERAGYARGFDHPADSLIDLSDEGMTVKNLRPFFLQLRDELLKIIRQIESKPPVEDSCLKGSFPLKAQEDLARGIVAKLGYDFARGRLDKTHHPFCISFSTGDVRITTRYREDDFTDSLFSTIHEAGHAMYEQGIATELEGTLLAHGVSSGVHESQSRLWENLVGRSLRFWEFFYKDLQASFPQFKTVPVATFYRALNRVERGLIRTDADEVTYNLHILIRFELECELLEGKLKVKDLSEIWKQRYQNDLGVQVPNDKDGVLQDVHWYGDFIGGQFQGYTLGNIMAAQFLAAAKRANPSIDDEITQGNFATLKSWLTQNIYRHGSRFSPEVILKRATGSDLTLAPYLSYLKDKYL